MMKGIVAMTLLIAAAGFSKAQNWQKNDTGIQTTINKTKIEILFYSPSIVRILKSPENASFDKASLSVISRPRKTTFTTRTQSGILTIKTDSVIVKCDLASGGMSFYDKTGA